MLARFVKAQLAARIEWEKISEDINAHRKKIANVTGEATEKKENSNEDEEKEELEGLDILPQVADSDVGVIDENYAQETARLVNAMMLDTDFMQFQENLMQEMEDGLISSLTTGTGRLRSESFTGQELLRRARARAQEAREEQGTPVEARAKVVSALTWESMSA